MTVKNKIFGKIDCQSWQYALISTTFWRLLVFLIAILGYFLLAERYAPSLSLSGTWKNNFLFWSWANFDGEHYLRIAQSGYGYNGTIPLFAFFPFYPLLLKVFSYVFRGDLFLSGQLIILVFLPLFVYFFNKILKNKGLTRKQIVVADSLFLFSPGAIFLNAFYTELPFLLLTVLSFYFLDQKKYGWASFWALLASSTRVVGVFLSIAIFWALLGERKINWLKKITFSFAATFGLLFYSVYLGLKFGNPLLFGLSQKSWGKAQFVFPLTTLMEYIKTVFSPPETLAFLNYFVVILEFSIAIVALLSFTILWIKAIKQETASPLLIFSTLCFVLPFSTGSLGTMPRYLLTFLSLFPFWTRAFLKIKSKPAQILVLSSIFFIFSSGVILFTRGYWWG